MTKIGERVGAILSADGDRVQLLGFGKYVGDEVPGEGIAGFNIGIPNPKIVLDSGKVVFGCECWWGTESQIRKQIGSRKIVEVDIDDARAKK